MPIVLDSNEFIYGLQGIKPSSRKLLEGIALAPERYSLRIVRSIVTEVQRNLAPEDFRAFVVFIQNVTTIDEDMVVPYEFARSYEARGLKPGDAFIAAYTEHVGAGCLISENRHFLSRQGNLPFKVYNAATFITEFKPKH